MWCSDLVEIESIYESDNVTSATSFVTLQIENGKVVSKCVNYRETKER